MKTDMLTDAELTIVLYMGPTKLHRKRSCAGSDAIEIPMAEAHRRGFMEQWCLRCG